MTNKLFTPSWVIVETNNTCQLRCPACSTTTSRARARGHLSRATLERLLDQITWKLDMMDFSWSGEPLLNPELPTLLRVAADRGHPVGLATNGMELKARADSLPLESMSRIVVGLDGADQATLKRYRVGGDFNTIFKSLARVVELCRARGSDCGVVWQLLLTKHTVGQIDDVIRLAREIGVDQVWLKTFNVFQGSGVSQTRFQKLAKTYLPESATTRYVRSETGSIIPSPDLLEVPCNIPESTVVMLFDGRLVPCCIDFDATHVLGDLSTSPLLSIWHGEAYRRFREGAVCRTNSICAMCTFPGSFEQNQTIEIGSPRPG